jgi:hypothetical protein
MEEDWMVRTCEEEIAFLQCMDLGDVRDELVWGFRGISTRLEFQVPGLFFRFQVCLQIPGFGFGVGGFGVQALGFVWWFEGIYAICVGRFLQWCNSTLVSARETYGGYGHISVL